MRDPERVYRIVNKLTALWSVGPDWRFGQLVYNLSRPECGDIFNIEDDEWEERIERLYSEVTYKGAKG